MVDDEPILKVPEIASKCNIDYNLSHKTAAFLFAFGVIFTGLVALQHTEATVIEELTNNNNYTLPELFKRVNQSVVQISTTDENTAYQLGSRLGSGFIYDSDGHIITNYHVVNGGNELLVTFSDGSAYNGELIGSDPYSDLAVIKVNTTTREKLLPLPIGNSSNLVVGQPVAAVGNPFGLSGSMSEGIISGLGRQLPSSSLPPEEPLPPLFGRNQIPSRTSSFSIPDIIQTDAAINPGNSGGPLLNMKGEVIGINSAIFSNTGVYAGVGFAIPSNTVKKVVASLVETGSYDHPWLGIVGVDITPAIGKVMNLSLTDSKGFLVTDVNANGPADKAGIQGGDRITQINGTDREINLGGDIIIGIDKKAVRNIDDMLAYLELEKRVGENVTIKLIRSGEPLEKILTLEKRPDSESISQMGNKQLSLGVTGIDVNPTIAKAMNLTNSKGFLVTSVTSNGPADKAGIQGGFKVETINNTQYTLGGDVITGVDNNTINTVQDIKNYIDTKNEGDIVKLKVIRDGEIKNIDVKLELLTSTTTEDREPFDQLNPFSDENRDSQRDFLNNQPPFQEDLKKQCLETFNDSICRFLFP
ncbi:MAG TPA: trypsin-like peptidase domain-containing protein [Nitrososphaeraceae archaeon]|nr:trypsin-like peptidase domain-containing protein [Nitrososphaeraceae archaeon]